MCKLFSLHIHIKWSGVHTHICCFFPCICENVEQYFLRSAIFDVFFFNAYFHSLQWQSSKRLKFWETTKYLLSKDKMEWRDFEDAAMNDLLFSFCSSDNVLLITLIKWKLIVKTFLFKIVSKKVKFQHRRLVPEYAQTPTEILHSKKIEASFFLLWYLKTIWIGFMSLGLVGKVRSFWSCLFSP